MKLSTKLKQVLTCQFLIFSILFFVLLFVFKDNLNNHTSKAIQAQVGFEIQNSESAFIDSAYNYSGSGLSYDITFLEFGSKGCLAWKQ